MKLLRLLSVLLASATLVLAEQKQDYAAALQPFVENQSVSGAVALVADKEQILSVTTVGLADISASRAEKEDDLFWIASMTKPMTAVCIGILVDEGKLAWNDPVEKHLPEFKGQWFVSEFGDKKRVLEPSPRPITIHDLCTHSSGLGNANAPRKDSTLAELCMAYAREPLFFTPGAKWNYSNSGINTLGRLVEVASGVPFAEFLKKRVFDPLGMKDTTFWPSAEQLPRVVKSYKQNKDGKLEETNNFFISGGLSDRTRTPYPAGGLYSTARDVARFYQMMLRGGEGVLKKETLTTMITTQSGELRTGFTDGMSWGYGFQVVKNPTGVTAMLSPGTFGHGGAYGTQSWADPVKGRIYVLMIQRSGMPNGDASEIRKAFQEAAAK